MPEPNQQTRTFQTASGAQMDRTAQKDAYGNWIATSGAHKGSQVYPVNGSTST